MEHNSYLRVANDIRSAIITGKYLPGQKIPSVRALAKYYSLSTATVARGICVVENEGLLIRNRTAGTYVIKDKSFIMNTKQVLAEKIVEDFLEAINNIGIENETILHMLKEQCKDCA